ncbi:MAG TPA: potassium-transporting ATPase subunit F [Solirubrobacterales bacterium]|nr:potassium-transporting ATPase subunit F [Solirubrobacterales bacterium]
MTLTLATLTGADVFGLVVSALVCVYLVYALLRGEKL